MNRMKKISCAALLLLTGLSLASCGGTSSSSVAPVSGDSSTPLPPDVKEYVMEAEYIDLTDVKGAGLSSEQAGVDMIYGDGTDAQKDLGWSSGYYIGYTYSTQTKLDFVFTADDVFDATFILRLGSELGDLNITPDDMEVALNGNAISYGSMYVEGSESMAVMTFYDKTCGTNLDLVKGENTLSISIKENMLRGNGTGGPCIDCVKIQSKAKITYEVNEDNPSKRGQI